MTSNILQNKLFQISEYGMWFVITCYYYRTKAITTHLATGCKHHKHCFNF